MPIASINPATGQLLESYEEIDDTELEERLELASRAFKKWRWLDFKKRAQYMQRVAALLEGETERWAKLISTEMGKPIKSAIVEMEKCALVCRYYAEHAADFLADEPLDTDASMSYVRYQPLGPILLVMPWNSPFWQIFRFSAPGLMAGNVALLKHASNVPQCALAVEDIFRRAGIPQGVFQLLLIGSSRVESVLSDPRVEAFTFTGSTQTGSVLAGMAGAHIKKAVLELGGSDPFIVLPSGDIDEAVKVGVRARLRTNGQSCVAAKRFIIHRDIAEVFEDRFVKRMASMQVGDPLDSEIDVGPLATKGLLEGLQAQVDKTIAAGARILLGGQILDRPGNFFPPTVLCEIPSDSPAYKDELFGPVASLFRVDSLDEAIALANNSVFGLGTSAWTNVAEEGERIIKEVQAGMVFINGQVRSDPRMPFGGIKKSGYGRELGRHGIREFVNVKTIWIR
jgi:succinate-semialdehyde dehydrogenase/glutarate-semialdehyde dehydrogenase